jgi:signal transduction histidine kinase
MMTATHRQQFICEASRILAESIDYEATLRSVARLAVPDVADWCVVDLVAEDGQIARVAIEHRDANKRNIADELKQQFPPVRDAANGPGRVLRTRRTDYQERIPQSFIDDAEPDRLALLRRLGLQSYICTPLIARGHLLGTITFFTEAGRVFSSADVDMTEDLARRSAMAIDNARLFEEAQRAVRSRDDMLAIVSHDLRTPLSAIMMAAAVQIATARETDDGRRLRQQAEVCQRAAEHMLRLISDLTDIGHIEAQRLAIERRAHDPATLVREVVATLQVVAAEQGSCLQCECGDDLPSIECDRDRIVQVLSNLVANAVKVCAPAITVSAHADDSAVVFTVRDTGPGISDADLLHVFDRYWRGTDKYKGTGLGLPIAKGIIEAHGSCCSVSSEVGAGTRFSFALPRSSAAATASLVPAVSTTPAFRDGD